MKIAARRAPSLVVLAAALAAACGGSSEPAGPKAPLPAESCTVGTVQCPGADGTPTADSSRWTAGWGFVCADAARTPTYGATDGTWQYVVCPSLPNQPCDLTSSFLCNGSGWQFECTVIRIGVVGTWSYYSRPYCLNPGANWVCDNTHLLDDETCGMGWGCCAQGAGSTF
ncbi:MAG TPA: hypothetical protein VMT17_15880 [Anaeromyxobacteraceae bacterium]|nr:hypothetical protein [Anaeromyxobacteraceae bacterium]